MPKGNYKRKNYKKRSKLAPSTKNEIKHIVTKVIDKRSETKQYAAGVGQTNFYNGAGASVFHMTAMSQGTLDNQRIGDEIYLKHIQMRFILRNGIGATANEYNLCRIMIFQYKSQDNTPVANELLLSSLVPPVAARAATSSRDVDYLNLYNVLFDKTYMLQQGTPNAGNYGQVTSQSRYVQINVPLKRCKRKIQFESAGVGTVNGIYCMVIGQHATAGVDPTYAVGYNISYSDS